MIKYRPVVFVLCEIFCALRSRQRKSVFMRVSSWRSQTTRTQREPREIQGLRQFRGC